jgi:hypothetical protein
MKSLIITVLVAITFVATCIIGFGFTQRVDMWKMDDDSHTFGYWDESFDIWSGEEPKHKVTIPLTPTPEGKLNYICNPSSSKFNAWIGYSVVNTSKFNLEGYKELVCN